MSEETYEHNIGDHEDPVADTTWLVGIVSAVILVAIFLGLTSLFYSSEEEEFDAKVVVPEATALKELKAQQNLRLHGVYRHPTLEGRYVIPIENAIDEYLKDPYASTVPAE